MATKFVIKNPSITVNSVDLSAWVKEVSLEEKFTVLDATTSNSAGAKGVEAGIVEYVLNLLFVQDFTSAAVEQTINAVGSSLVGTKTTIVVQPTAGAASVTNPKWTGTVLVSEWMPLKGKIGDLAEVQVSWPADGAFTKASS